MSNCAGLTLSLDTPTSGDWIGTTLRSSINLLTISLSFLLPMPLSAEEVESSVARGGRLYDKWWKVVGAQEPKGANPAYPADGKYKGKGGTDWRCKECHGWD